jgi:hypothetical protein
LWYHQTSLGTGRRWYTKLAAYGTSERYVTVSNTQQQYQPQANIGLPETLDTADAKLVYLYLHTNKNATIDELQADLGMKKITLYPLLRTLTATDHVERAGTLYVCQQQTADGGNL